MSQWLLENNRMPLFIVWILLRQFKINSSQLKIAISRKRRRSERGPAKTAFLLCPGKWGRLRYNGRFVEMDSGNWFYEKTVVNIGLLFQPAVDIFFATPHNSFSDMARLL